MTSLSRAWSVDCETSELLLTSLEFPKSLIRSSSDGMSIENTKLKSRYEVRTCRVEDAASIYSIMMQTWPEHHERRNERYWTKQFLEVNKRYGFIIEEVQSNKNEYYSNLDSIQEDNSKSDDVDMQETKLKKSNNPSTDAKNRKVVGICMYMWNAPGPHENWTWRETDWALEYQSDFNNPHWSSDGCKAELGLYKKEFAKYAFNPNVNLDKHFDLIKTHFVHITDVAIHPNYRGHDLGSQLMQTVVYSFPNGTKFGLEVETTNIGAIKCYAKSGFNIIREVKGYYGYDQLNKTSRNAYKMSMVSNFDEKEVEEFFQTCQLKYQLRRLAKLQQSLQEFSKKGKSRISVKLSITITKPNEINNNNSDNNSNNNNSSIGTENENVVEVGDPLINDMLRQLELESYINSFAEHGITTDTLPDLDIQFLEYVILVSEDRERFVQWLQEFQSTERKSARLENNNNNNNNNNEDANISDISPRDPTEVKESTDDSYRTNS